MDLPQQPPPQGSPPRPPRGGLALSAGGLLATLVLASSALSMTGTIATIAASFAGVFSFKLAKDLSSCGVSKFTVQQTVARTVASTAQVHHSPCLSVASYLQLHLSDDFPQVILPHVLNVASVHSASRAARYTGWRESGCGRCVRRGISRIASCLGTNARW